MNGQFFQCLLCNSYDYELWPSLTFLVPLFHSPLSRLCFSLYSLTQSERLSVRTQTAVLKALFVLGWMDGWMERARENEMSSEGWKEPNLFGSWKMSDVEKVISHNHQGEKEGERGRKEKQRKVFTLHFFRSSSALTRRKNISCVLGRKRGERTRERERKKKLEIQVTHRPVCSHSSLSSHLLSFSHFLHF